MKTIARFKLYWANLRNQITKKSSSNWQAFLCEHLQSDGYIYEGILTTFFTEWNKYFKLPISTLNLYTFLSLRQHEMKVIFKLNSLPKEICRFKEYLILFAS